MDNPVLKYLDQGNADHSQDVGMGAKILHEDVISPEKQKASTKLKFSAPTTNPGKITQHLGNAESGFYDVTSNTNDSGEDTLAFDARKIGLPSQIRNQDVFYGTTKEGKEDRSMLYVEDHSGGDGKPYSRVHMKIGEDGSLTPVSRQFVYRPKPTSIAHDIAPVVGLMASFIPGLGTAIGSAIGASGVGASIAGGAILGGASSAIGGGDILKGALMGGIGGSAAGLAGGLTDSLGATGAKIAAGAATGAARGLVSGQNPIASAVMGGLPSFDTGSSFANTILNNVFKQAASKALMPAPAQKRRGT